MKLTFNLVFFTVFISFSVFGHSNCHPVKLHHCSLPFPSNHQTVADSNSPTGLKLQVGDDFISQAVTDRIPSSTHPEHILNGLNGFSPAAPILFELGKNVSPEAIPIDGEGVVKVVDMTTGSLVPVRVRLSKVALDSDLAIQNTLLEITPRTRFPFGHTLVAALTTNLKAIDQSPLPVPQATVLFQRGTHPLQQHYQNAFDYLLSSGGIGLDEVISFTVFTVNDEYSITDKFLSIAETVREQSHPIRNLSTFYNIVGPIKAVVKGQVRLSSFRNGEGKVIYTPGDQGTEYWTDFVLHLPWESKFGPVPVQIYGHGIGVFKETLSVMSIPNANAGVATLAIDQPNHGSRIISDGGFVLTMLNPDNIPRVVGMTMQSSIDMHSLVEAIQTAMQAIDVLPKHDNLLTRLMYGGVGKPDIDSNRIIYGGTSLGGVLGSAFLSTARDIKSGFLQVSGAGITNTLSHSFLYKNVGFNNLVPPQASGIDAALLMSITQHSLDMADGINFVHMLRDAPAGVDTKPVVVQYGLDDNVVFNDASIAIAELADLPLVRPVLPSSARVNC